MPDFSVFRQISTNIRGLEGIFDGVLKEDHKRTVNLSDYPVEMGYSITDNAVREPDTLEIDAFVSAFSFEKNSRISALKSQFNQIRRSFRPPIPIFRNNNNEPLDEDIITSSATRDETAWREIDSLMNTFNPVTIVTQLGIYTDMVLTNAETTKDVNNRRGLAVSLTFKKIRINTGLFTVDGEQLIPDSNGPAKDLVGSINRGNIGTINVGRTERTNTIGRLPKRGRKSLRGKNILFR